MLAIGHAAKIRLSKIRSRVILRLRKTRRLSSTSRSTRRPFRFPIRGPSTDLDAPATYAADVFSFILRQPDSKFSRALIDSGIITAIVQLGYLTQRNVGPITISVQANLDKFKTALKAVNEEIAKFDSPDYFSDQELEYAKTCWM